MADIWFGAVANATTMNAGKINVYYGATADNTVVNGGVMEILENSDATNTTVNGGRVNVNSGGVVTDTQVNRGSFEIGSSSEGSMTVNSGGELLMDADTQAESVVLNQGSGQYSIRVTDSGKEISSDGDLTVNLINDKSSGTSYTLKSSSGEAMEAIDGGTYMCSLYKQVNKDGMTGDVWYLGEYQTTVDPTAPGEELPGGGTGESHPKTTPSTDAILSMASASTVIVNSKLDALRTYRRAMGVSAHEWNVWGHYMGDVARRSDIGTSSYKLYQNGLEIGADRTLAYDAEYLAFGGLVSYTDNRVGHARGGKSSVDSYGIGAYSTWYDNRGFYIDGVQKANRLSSDLSATMTNGGRTSGDWHQYLNSSSLEAGFQFKLSEL